MKRILVTGATGQIGSELTMALRQRCGGDNVVAGIHLRPPNPELARSGPSWPVDCLDSQAIAGAVERFQVDTIYHLVALLSCKGEEAPALAWQLNMGTLRNVLEVARTRRCAVFFPSSIGVFGPETPRRLTPQETVLRPTTIYGVTKVAGELLCDYYHGRFGLEVRGLRYPGIISYKTPPGGGTTDYAVEIFHRALDGGRYECYLGPETYLDMMYMPDAVRAAIMLMEAEPSRLKHRNAFNVTAMSASPALFEREIRRHIPDFSVTYRIDPLRQRIADSWPDAMDDQAAREEWGWKPDYDLAATTREMLSALRQ
jgi:nucleoside-diphosphate-sugar epimerase